MICECLFHLSCVGFTKAQAEALGRWNCEQCRGVARVPARAETPPIDLVGYIGRCHHSLRVLNRIPKGAVIPVAEALQRLIREALDRGSELGTATAKRESGAWLNALPISSFATLLESESCGVAIALRVGADVCIPHSCRCGGKIYSRGLHGLSCKYSAGRFPSIRQ